MCVLVFIFYLNEANIFLFCFIHHTEFLFHIEFLITILISCYYEFSGDIMTTFIDFVYHFDPSSNALCLTWCPCNVIY